MRKLTGLEPALVSEPPTFRLALMYSEKKSRLAKSEVADRKYAID